MTAWLPEDSSYCPAVRWYESAPVRQPCIWTSVIIELKAVKRVNFIRTGLRAVALIGIVADNDGRVLIQIHAPIYLCCEDFFI